MTAAAGGGPWNFVAVGTYLGWHQNAFYPTETGAGYKMPATLQPLEEFRDDFTILSGLDHRAPNGHNNWSNFLCGQNPKGLLARSNNRRSDRRSITSPVNSDHGRIR